MRVLAYRPAPDTVFGVIAILIVSAWSVTALSARNADDRAPQAATSGEAANYTVVRGEFTTIKGDFSIARADCPAGQAVISGGHASTSQNYSAFGSLPSKERDGWVVALSNVPPMLTQSGTIWAYAVCAEPGEPIIAP